MGGPVARVSDQVDNCVICYDPYKNDTFITHCKHKFDTECINNWIKEKSNGGTCDVPCPLCRRVIIPKDSIHPELSHVRIVFRANLPPRIAPRAASSLPVPLNEPSAQPPLVGSREPYFTPLDAISNTLGILNTSTLQVFSAVPNLAPLTPERLRSLRDFVNRTVSVGSPLFTVQTSIRSILNSINLLSQALTRLTPLNPNNLIGIVGMTTYNCYGPSRYHGPLSIYSNMTIEINGRAYRVHDLANVNASNPFDVPEDNLYDELSNNIDDHPQIDELD